MSTRSNPGTDDTTRQNPEVFLDMIRGQHRGRLKIYLGFAAGVGKTYQMLQEGNRLHRQGVDVVVGLVETHGRAETIAQVGELELIRAGGSNITVSFWKRWMSTRFCAPANAGAG